MTLPPCPMCGHNQHAQHSGELFYCRRHKLYFDNRPDDSGPAYNDPVRNAESKEEFRIRQQQWDEFPSTEAANA